MGYFLLRFIVYSLLFYFFFKIIRSLVQLFSKPEEQKMKVPIQNVPGKKQFDINSEDIIDAEFTDIKSDESKDEKK